jgi:dTDP-4-dehydrorhamnose reductase
MTLNDSKIVILGGRGMLGTDLVKAFNEQKIYVQVFDLPEFDITNFIQLKETIKKADIIINCAAYTNVDGAEKEKELAYKVNAEAVGRIGEIARDNNAWVLHISTDFVFDGKQNRPYIENDIANPLSEYGMTKLAGEQLLAQSGCNYCIIRVEWTYGRAGNNFVSKLIQRARTNNTVNVVDDQVGSPTATTEVSNAICELIPKKPLGLFHFANSGYVSRYEMAEFIFDNLMLDVNLVRCKTSDYVTSAARPLNSRFDCTKITELLGRQIEPWQTVLERYLNNI